MCANYLLKSKLRMTFLNPRTLPGLTLSSSSPMRIKVAPLVCLAGYLFMIVAILWRSKDDAAKTDKEG